MMQYSIRPRWTVFGVALLLLFVLAAAAALPATAALAAGFEQVREPEGNVNDFWLNTPWDEMTAEEQALWSVLGWHADNWDGTGDLPQSEMTVWAGLSADEQAAAATLGYDEAAWNEVIIRKPSENVDSFWVNTPWEDLTPAEQAAWAILGWNAGNWDGTGDLPQSEMTVWADLSAEEQATAARFGYDEDSWNAVIIRQPADDVNDFWLNTPWDQLTPAEQAAWATLGWNASNWDGTGDLPQSEITMWADLSAEDQATAARFGYDEDSWNDVIIRQPAEDVNDFWVSTPWEEMTAAEQSAWATLGWDAASWAGDGELPASETTLWADLTPEEQAAAARFGYGEAAWNAVAVCTLADQLNSSWIDTPWEEIEAEDQARWNVLGWNAENWDGEGELPQSELTLWAGLSAEEQAAAAELGYTEAYWNAVIIRLPAENANDFWVNTPWDQLTFAEQEAWKLLGWNAGNWDGTGDLPQSEMTVWADLSDDEQALVARLGYDEAAWNAVIIRKPVEDVNNFWVNIPWEELTSAEQSAWATLGWGADNWDGEGDLPQSEMTVWAGLTPEQQATVARFGYDEAAWNEVIIRKPSENVNDFWVNTPWEELTPAEQEAWASLGWSADNWDGEGELPQSEMTVWADLSAEEQATASSFGYDEVAWNAVIIRKPAENVNDFWLNTPWEELTPAEQAAWATLGWNAGNWDGEGELPASESTLWADLTPEQQATVARFGYDEDSWNAGLAGEE